MYAYCQTLHYDAWSYQKKKHKKIKAYIFRKNLQLKDFY